MFYLEAKMSQLYYHMADSGSMRVNDISGINTSRSFEKIITFHHSQIIVYQNVLYNGATVTFVPGKITGNYKHAEPDKDPQTTEVDPITEERKQKKIEKILRIQGFTGPVEFW
jgi:hypothetical protein